MVITVINHHTISTLNLHALDVATLLFYNQENREAAISDFMQCPVTARMIKRTANRVKKKTGWEPGREETTVVCGGWKSADGVDTVPAGGLELADGADSVPTAVLLEGKEAAGACDVPGEVERARKEMTECTGCEGYPCKKQKREGTVPVIREGNVIGRALCEHYKLRREQAKTKRILKASGIPERYTGEYEADGFNREALEACKGLEAGKVQGVYVYGAAGVGKSFLAAQTAKAVMASGREVVFENTACLLDEFYGAIRTGISEQGLYERLWGADLLVLDDFGQEKATQYAGAVLSKIIDGRYRTGKQTLITSNYSPKEACRRHDEPADGGESLNGTRMLDRLRETMAAVKIKGKSRRHELKEQ